MNIARLIALQEADWQMAQRGLPEDSEERKQVARMVKYAEAEKGEGREKADWEADVYPLALKKAELVPNKFYRGDPDAMTREYGQPDEDGAWYKDGKRVYPDWPEDAHQWSLVFEVIDGEKKGDWLFAYASPRFGLKKDGSWFGKLAAIIGAIDKSALPIGSGPWALIEDGALTEFYGRPLRASVEPKKDPQYAKVNQYLPMKPADAAKYLKAAAEAQGMTVDEPEKPVAEMDDIPF